LSLPRAVTAGLLLAGIFASKDLDLAMPTAAAALLATGASKTTAYKAKALIEECLPGLIGQIGRPPAPRVVTPTDAAALTRAVLEYVYAHPGAVSAAGTRRRYSDGFRIFILDQFAAHHEVDLEAFAVAVGIPAGTIKDWVSGERPDDRILRPEVSDVLIEVYRENQAAQG
jgi:hypothetical protein